MRLCFAWTRRVQFKPWTGWIGVYLYHRDGPSGTDSNITATPRCLCSRLLIHSSSEVIGQTTPRHTSQQFVTFLGEVVGT
jgi:hypothetical protein